MIADELRGGTGDTVFVICGAGGAAEELAGLARAFDGDPRVIALVPRPAPDDTEPATTVETMATAAVALVRSHEPHGPYRLLGYSLGGIVALETGRLLEQAGQRVSFLGIVDAFFDRRYWPGALFIRASVRRSAVHARGLLGQPPVQASRELRGRIRRLAQRLGGRFGAQDVEDSRPNMTVKEGNLLAMARWRPRVFEGDVVLFTTDAPEFGCDLADLWRPWLPRMHVRRLPGSHLQLVQEPDGIALLAKAVDEALADSTSPRLRTLVATTFRWPGAARLAVELHGAGCDVQAVAPRGSALHKIAAVERSYALGLIDPAGTLRRAIESSCAELIIPFDDRTRQTLHRIYSDADPTTDAGARLRNRLERSLGSPELYGCLYSRVAIMDIAAECGVLRAPTATVRSADDIGRWLAQHPGSAVVKTDGSWGGREARVICTEADGRKAWRQLSRPPGLARCIKRLLLERDPWPLRSRTTGERPRLSIQAYVDGDAGNAAVACLDGEMLGAVQAEVMQSDGPTGPSTVLRVVEHPEMLAAARAIVNRLGASGFVGLDFIRESGTGRAHLIEVNPRATPTAHLVSAEGIDLLASLRSVLGYAGPPPRTTTYRDGCVALFPAEMERDPTSGMLDDAYHDVPWQAPDLVEHALSGLHWRGASHIRDRLASLARDPAHPPSNDRLAHPTPQVTNGTGAPCSQAAADGIPAVSQDPAVSVGATS